MQFGAVSVLQSAGLLDGVQTNYVYCFFHFLSWSAVECSRVNKSAVFSAVSWFAGWDRVQTNSGISTFLISFSLSAPSSYHLAISKLVPIALFIYNFAFWFPPLPRSMFYLLIDRKELIE